MNLRLKGLTSTVTQNLLMKLVIKILYVLFSHDCVYEEFSGELYKKHK
jgi:hypothetical protein